MDVRQALHMKGGDDNSSYARNSSYQKLAITKSKHILEQSIRELCRSINTPTKCIRVADLGCASGPNTFLTIRGIIDCIYQECESNKDGIPSSIQVFLNDLESNDFNTIFKSLPNFYEQLEKHGRQSGRLCFIAAMPGSFYGRLFPDNFIHFFHCSFSLHWLSESPKTEMGVPLNKGNIYISKTSPSNVHDAYLDQFEKDFANFLRMRAVEMVPCGQVFLTLLSNCGDDIYDMLGMALNDMVVEGLIEEATLDAFNLPIYETSMEEVRQIIEKEGSFKIRHLETIEMGKNEDDLLNSMKEVISDRHALAEYWARNMRAVFEHILASQFGDGMMDDLFCRFAQKISLFSKMEISKIVVASLSK